MTNAQIVFMKEQELAEAGTIAYTGKTIVMVMNGVPAQFKETEKIHTFMEWKKAGYMVQKGQKAIAKFTIWNFTDKPSKTTKALREAAEKDPDAADPHYYMKEAAFFSASQVAPIEK